MWGQLPEGTILQFSHLLHSNSPGVEREVVVLTAAASSNIGDIYIIVWHTS
jgi:hypothetical protein